MSEVLSQNEIDALLNALTTGEVDVAEMKEEKKEKKIRTYDFRNPQKMAKDQLRTLEIIHESFSRLLQTFLSGYLRTSVKSSVMTVDQYAYSEFSNAISNPAFLSIINLDPLPGEMIIDITPDLAFIMIDRLLGGDGNNTEADRTFTEIELILLKKMMNKLLKLIAEAWENVIELKPQLEKIETNPQFAQIVSPSETIVLITMNLSIGETEGMLNICMPHISIESILDKLNTKLWFSTNNKSLPKDEMKRIETRLRNASVMVSGELGRSVLSVKELLELQIGDIITLDTYKEDQVLMKIGSHLKFYGEAGSNNNHLAIKITSVKRDGDQKDDE